MPLFPEIAPYDSGHLKVSPLHEIHYEQCGNPDGKPVVYIHGGPGAGLSRNANRFFDPEKWRIILFSQRGSGQSRPFAELKENTTWHLVDDMEALRNFLEIERWTLFGGSWGSTLSLCYAIKHPERCLSLVLRGIFLSRNKELLWLYQEGASKIFPDYFRDFIAPVPPDERDKLIPAYYRLLTSNDKDTRNHAAKAWSQWEGRISRLVPNAESIATFEDLGFAEAFSKIECHYFINGSFLPHDNFILDHADQIKHLPMSIIQGRYDIVCPFESAWDLHQCLPASKLVVASSSGHSTAEKEICTALMKEVESHYHFAASLPV